MGRPSTYTEETTSTICERLAAGESLRRICLEQEMPDQTTVYKWVMRHEAFAQQYARARLLQADTLFDEVLDISDGLMPVEDEAERDVARDRLRIDTRKWIAGKLRPQKYNDKLAELPEPEAPTEMNLPDLYTMAQTIAFALAKAAHLAEHRPELTSQVVDQEG
jgi:hypothetical protein